MKKEKESIRKRITAFWKETEKDIEKRKAFISFMEKNELSQSAIYNYMRSDCVGVPMFKLKAIQKCIEEFSDKIRDE